MDTILIVCGAGASSTFLANRMRSLFRSRSLPVTVEATSYSDGLVRLGSVSLVLVGPHLADSFPAIATQAAEVGIPASLLPPTVFGPGGAEAATELALGLLATVQSSHHPATEGISHG